MDFYTFIKIKIKDIYICVIRIPYRFTLYNRLSSIHVWYKINHSLGWIMTGGQKYKTNQSGQYLSMLKYD